MAFRELCYQTRALTALDTYLTGLVTEKAGFDKVLALAAENVGLEIPLPDYPAKTWARPEVAALIPPGRRTTGYSPRSTGDGKPAPNLTLKVPTGGGKTYLACAAISRIFGRYLATNTGFVLWIVPNEAIYTQTLKALRDRQHPYRQTLDRTAAGRVLVLEKTDTLNRADVDDNLCVMVLMLQSSNRENKDTLKLFQDQGDVHGFSPQEGDQAGHKALLERVSNLSQYDLGDGGSGWPMVKDSVGNALRIIRPVVVMDEGQKAVSDLAFHTLYDFNPCLVLELSATPKDVAARKASATIPARPARTANILIEITGRELEREGMIKMPLNIAPVPGVDWKKALSAALAKLNDLDAAAKAWRAEGGRYIRPILLVQAERVGADQTDAGLIHGNDIKAWLIKAGLDEAEIAFKTAEVNDLEKPENRDLLKPACRVRAIITKAALAEGWDCPFAYVLCSLAANGNEAAMTQLVGRILRQPHAMKTGVDLLDESYVFTHRAETQAVVTAIKQGLTNDGLSDLVRDVVLTPGGTGGGAKKRPLKRADAFRTYDIALPRVLWTEGGKPRPVDVESDLYPILDWTKFDAEALAETIPDNAQAAEAQIIRLHTGEKAGFETDAAKATEGARGFDGAHAVRMISDLVPNSFVARDLVGRVLVRLSTRGFDTALIGRLVSLIVDELRRALGTWRDTAAAAVFRDAFADGRIQFQLRGDDGDWIMPQQLWTTAEDGAAQLAKGNGTPLERSVFLPIYAADLNDEERRVAVYLDDDSAIRWWHRNGVDRASYGLRGWRRGNVYPDFVFAALKDGSGERIVAVESKGDQLAGNMDSEYKRQLLETLTEAYARHGGAGARAVGRAAADFEAAVVLFSDMKAKLPVLIGGAKGRPEV
jgi:type III restriction enzyme